MENRVPDISLRIVNVYGRGRDSAEKNPRVLNQGDRTSCFEQDCPGFQLNVLFFNWN